MEDHKEDRRIRRTKKLLKQALAQLMDEKEFKDITVRDITERADLNRGTFYLHYTDTYDILNKIENEILFNIQSMVDEKTNSADLPEDLASCTLMPIAEYIKENADIFRCLMNNKVSADFIEKFRDFIFKNCSEIIKRRFSIKDNNINDYYFSFITYGIIGVIKEWLEKKPLIDVSEIVQFADSIINSSVEAIKG